MTSRRRTAFAFSAAALGLIVACHSGAPDYCSDGTCLSSDAQLESCAAFGTGIYGATTLSYEGSGSPPPPTTCAGGGGVAVEITGSDGKTTAVTGQPGDYYVAALSPGNYTVCCPGGTTNASCATIALPAGYKVRLDSVAIESAGGDYCSMRCEEPCPFFQDAGN